jgi:hypothetical protein
MESRCYEGAREFYPPNYLLTIYSLECTFLPQR